MHLVHFHRFSQWPRLADVKRVESWNVLNTSTLDWENLLFREIFDK